MFLGTYTPKLDDKGRLTLPAKFRDALAGGLMVTKSQDHSLAVYPRGQFEQLARRASATSRSNPEARAFLRECQADRRAHALGRAGDDDHLVLELQVHDRLLTFRSR
jgi:division/cell wall cluster transcriptional repressor MraZ